MSSEASESPAVVSCPQCRALLDVRGSRPGSWLVCPACGTPVLVPRGAPVRPEAAAVSSDLDAQAEAKRRKETLDQLLRGRKRRVSVVPLVMVGVLAGFVSLLYVFTVAGGMPSGGVSASWAFGFLMAIGSIIAYLTIAGGSGEGKGDG